MKLVAILPVRNEGWILGLTLRALLQWVDCVLVMAHACTDDTHKILCDVVSEVGHERLVWWTDNSADWHEMKMRSELLSYARVAGATHIVTLDADEMLTANLLSSIRGIIERTATGSILRLPGYNLRGGLLTYHSNGIWANRWFSTAFAEDQRLHWGGDQFHHREPMGLHLQPYTPIQQGQGGVLHFWGVDERRLRAKHALYRITERLRWPNKLASEIEETYRPATHGNWMGMAASWKFAQVRQEWLQPYSDLMERYYRPGCEVWQEAEIERALAEHGREHFKGLDLLGY